MRVFVWRHNRKFHSYSMIDEPNVHQDFYQDAVVIVIAANQEEAYRILADRESGWLVEELKRLEPKVFDCDTPKIVFEDVRG